MSDSFLGVVFECALAAANDDLLLGDSRRELGESSAVRNLGIGQHAISVSRLAWQACGRCHDRRIFVISGPEAAGVQRVHTRFASLPRKPAAVKSHSGTFDSDLDWRHLFFHISI